MISRILTMIPVRENSEVVMKFTQISSTKHQPNITYQYLYIYIQGFFLMGYHGFSSDFEKIPTIFYKFL